MDTGHLLNPASVAESFWFVYTHQIWVSRFSDEESDTNLLHARSVIVLWVCLFRHPTRLAQQQVFVLLTKTRVNHNAVRNRGTLALGYFNLIFVMPGN